MPVKTLTTTETAKFCNVTRFTIRNWIDSGKLKAYKTAGGHRRILEEDIVIFLKKNEIPNVNESKHDFSHLDKCLSCEYFNKYDSLKQKLISNKKHHIINSIQDMIDFKEINVPALFKKSFYVSGKYIASIKKVISGKKRNRIMKYLRTN